MPAATAGHCWVDLLWVRWRLKHPDSPYEGTGAGDGIDDPLSNWPDRTPADVIDHLALGYQYDVESLVA